MRSTYALDVCAWRMRHLYALGVCANRMRKPYAQTVCANRMLKAYAVFVCGICMSLKPYATVTIAQPRPFTPTHKQTQTTTLHQVNPRYPRTRDPYPRENYSENHSENHSEKYPDDGRETPGQRPNYPFLRGVGGEFQDFAARPERRSRNWPQPQPQATSSRHNPNTPHKTHPNGEPAKPP